MKILVRVKGGAGSGNWGHAGRPGIVGGSGGRGGAAGRALVGTHLDTEIYKIKPSEITPERINDWFKKEGNEGVGLLYTRTMNRIQYYMLLGREMKGVPGKDFRSTQIGADGTPTIHVSYRTALDALEYSVLSVNRSTPRNKYKLVGGVWT